MVLRAEDEEIGRGSLKVQNAGGSIWIQKQWWILLRKERKKVSFFPIDISSIGSNDGLVGRGRFWVTGKN